MVDGDVVDPLFWHPDGEAHNLGAVGVEGGRLKIERKGLCLGNLCDDSIKGRVIKDGGVGAAVDGSGGLRGGCLGSCRRVGGLGFAGIGGLCCVSHQIFAQGVRLYFIEKGDELFGVGAGVSQGLLIEGHGGLVGEDRELFGEAGQLGVFKH